MSRRWAQGRHDLLRADVPGFAWAGYQTDPLPDLSMLDHLGADRVPKLAQVPELVALVVAQGRVVRLVAAQRDALGGGAIPRLVVRDLGQDALEGRAPMHRADALHGVCHESEMLRESIAGSLIR